MASGSYRDGLVLLVLLWGVGGGVLARVKKYQSVEKLENCS